MLILACVALFLACLVAIQRNWQTGYALLDLKQGVLASVSMAGPQVQAQPEVVEAKVMMVKSTIIKNPASEAYTYDLYISTGKDSIPWPHVGDRATVTTYVVQSGDSLWGIAKQFELDIDTLRWSNLELERNPDVLSVGTELNILPVLGVYHIIVEADTIESIASQYGVAPTDISDYPPNALYLPYELVPGEHLIIPYGHKNVALPQPSYALEASLAWPLLGVITNNFDPEQHPALDIGAPYGSTIYAADGGEITYADWSPTGYGYTIVIDHGNGRETWYNHLKGTLLPAGNVVTRGTPIGEVGSTGHSTGPHLHLELHLNGELVNPLDYLSGVTPQ